MDHPCTGWVYIYLILVYNIYKYITSFLLSVSFKPIPFCSIPFCFNKGCAFLRICSADGSLVVGSRMGCVSTLRLLNQFWPPLPLNPRRAKKIMRRIFKRINTVMGLHPQSHNCSWCLFVYFSQTWTTGLSSSVPLAIKCRFAAEQT